MRKTAISGIRQSKEQMPVRAATGPKRWLHHKNHVKTTVSNHARYMLKCLTLSTYQFTPRRNNIFPDFHTKSATFSRQSTQSYQVVLPDVFSMSSLRWPAWETSCSCSISMQASHFTSHRALVQLLMAEVYRRGGEGCMSTQSERREKVKRARMQSRRSTLLSWKRNRAEGTMKKSRMELKESISCILLQCFFRLHYSL